MLGLFFSSFLCGAYFRTYFVSYFGPKAQNLFSSRPSGSQLYPSLYISISCWRTCTRRSQTWVCWLFLTTMCRRRCGAVAHGTAKDCGERAAIQRHQQHLSAHVLRVRRPAREPKTRKPPKVLPRVLSGVLSEIGVLPQVLPRVLSRVLFLLLSTERTPGEHSREHS